MENGLVQRSTSDPQAISDHSRYGRRMSATPTSDTDLDVLRRRMRYLYQEYRTAIFNRKYYGHRLRIAKVVNRIFEIVIAVGASTAISVWTFWKTPVGAPVWQGVGMLAAILAVLKPPLNIAGDLERYTALMDGYSSYCFDTHTIIETARVDSRLDQKTWENFQASQKRLGDLAARDDTAPSKRLVERYFRETDKEVPANSLWMP